MTAPRIPRVARLAHDLFHHIGLRANLPASVRAPHLKMRSHVFMLSNKIAIPGVIDDRGQPTLFNKWLKSTSLGL